MYCCRKNKKEGCHICCCLHECKYLGCDRVNKNQSNFCFEHCCEFENCPWLKYKEKFCIRHSCLECNKGFSLDDELLCAKCQKICLLNDEIN